MDGLARNRRTSAVVAGLTVGCLLTWNVSNVGAVADPLADAYGVSLAVIGLLTTALFVTQLASQLPAGIWSDRIGPHRVALAACGAAAAGNALLLAGDPVGLAVVGRLVVGLGSGAGFVAGLAFDLPGDGRIAFVAIAALAAFALPFAGRLPGATDAAGARRTDARY